MRKHARLYQCLLDDLRVDPEQPITSDCSVSTVRSILMARSFLKKCTDELDPLADERALAKFVACNKLCATFSLKPSGLYEDVVVNEVISYFDNVAFTGPDLNLDLNLIKEGFGLGPGANLVAESYDFYTKLFDSKLSRTSESLYRLYRCAINDHPVWKEAELFRSSHRGDVLVAGSKLSFVPKTSEVSRTICTEPTLNMLFQKGIGAFLEYRLKRDFRIDLSYQPVRNGGLAWKGSVDGSFGTIDLSSASDSISNSLIESIIPRYFVEWLKLARSPVTTLPGGEELRLEMISSMGNAFTFPLQTMIFASLVVSCYRVLGIKPEYDARGPLNFGVFGDDIIVRSDAYDFVTRCLELFGFTVNVDKSFNNGSFRESCGSDYYAGYPVRGVYIKELKHETDVYSAINRVVRWSANSGIDTPSTLSHLKGMLPSKLGACYIPLWCGDAEGIKTPKQVLLEHPGLLSRAIGRFLTTGPERRLSGKLRLPPYRTGGDGCRVPARVRSYERARAQADRLCSDVFVFIRNEPKSVCVPSDIDKRGWTKQFGYNPDGLLLSFIGGYIRNGRISIRQDRRRAKVALGCSSFWDYNGAPGRVDDSIARIIGASLI